MKKVLVFILGILVGFIAGYFLAPSLYQHSISLLDEEREGLEVEESANPGIPDGVSLLDSPGGVLPYKSFKVHRVLVDGSAIAYADEDINEQVFYGVGVFILNENNAAYFDKQVIRLIGKKCRHIGTYKYWDDTYPVVRFEE